MDSPRIDQLTYDYYPKTNQLARIRDAVSHPLQGKGAGRFGDLVTQPDTNYVYDALGRLIADKSENYRIVYDAYDKVAEVRTLDQGKPIVRFVYDDGGHRVQKLTYTEAGAVEHVTYYFRDAQGNALGVYTQTGTTGPLALTEHTVYSSGRLGLFYRQENRYSYELKDHLGNVRAVVNRRVVDETNPPADPAPILAYLADYYPFGWLMPDRKVLEYRYGYNDQETDPETGWQAYKFREYDARVARFFRVDPLTKKFPYWTPYQFAGNSPVINRELEGLEPVDINEGNFIDPLYWTTVGLISVDEVLVEATRLKHHASSWQNYPLFDGFNGFKFELSLSLEIANRFAVDINLAYAGLEGRYDPAKSYHDWTSGFTIGAEFSAGGQDRDLDQESFIDWNISNKIGLIKAHGIENPNFSDYGSGTDIGIESQFMNGIVGQSFSVLDGPGYYETRYIGLALKPGLAYVATVSRDEITNYQRK